MRSVHHGWRRAGTLGVLVAAIAGLGSASIAVTTAAATAPTAPSSPTGSVFAAPGQDGSQVNWTVGPNGGDPVTAFVITTYDNGTATGTNAVAVGAAGSPLSPVVGAPDFYDFTGLTPSNDGISYTVAEVNTVGTGPNSAMSGVLVISDDPEIPYPVYDVSATVVGSGVGVQWTNGGGNGEPTTQINLQAIGTPVPPDGGQITLTPGAVGSSLDPSPGAVDNYTFTNLPPGGTYYVEVSVANTQHGYAGTYPADTNSVVAPTPSTAVITMTNPLAGQSPTNTNTMIDFGSGTLGDIADQAVIIKNTGAIAANIEGVNFGGADPDDYFVDPTENNGCTSPLQPGASCVFYVAFSPGAVGTRTATLTPFGNVANVTPMQLTGTGTEGYWIVHSNGVVNHYGDAVWEGDASTTHLTAPIIGMASTGDNAGYWLATSTGQVLAYGDAQNVFSLKGPLNKPIVGIAATPDGGGFWLVASDGGIFSFGDAAFYGSTGSLRLNKPIVGMASTPDGEGYWLVASDGGIFTFGDAPFYGSTGAIRLNKPVVGMAPTPDGGGYWLVASDGGIFTFGDASFYGSTGAIRLQRPIVGMAASPSGNGYWMVASDGGIFTFGDPLYLGSDGGTGTTNVAGMAYDGSPTLQAFLDIPAVRGGSAWGTRSTAGLRGT